MALNDYPMMFEAGSVKFEDATGGTPISITVAFEDGDFQHDEMQEGYFETEILQDRGVDYTIAKVREQRIGFSFTCHATDFYDATEKTVPDMVMKTGAFAAGVSVFGANRPWGLKMTFTVEQTNYGAGADTTLVFSKVRLTYAFAEGAPGKFTVKGVIFNPSSTITRS